MSMKKSKRFTPAFLLRDSAVSHREPSAELRFARANRRCSFYSLCAKKKEGLYLPFLAQREGFEPPYSCP